MIKAGFNMSFVPASDNSKLDITLFTISYMVNKKIYKITFIDSYKLLPSSLKL
jgi:hypothetical protein